MKLQFLGTGAADWKLEEHKNFPDFRRWSSAIIDGDLLIDPGPHIFDFSESFRLPNIYDGVKNIIVTHSHGDHFNTETVKKLFDLNPDIKIYGDLAIGIKLKDDPKCQNIDFVEIKLLEETQVGDYCIVALPGNHTDVTIETVRHYSIEKNGKKLFYGTDGGWLTCIEWNYMRNRKYDTMIFELTIGDVPGDYRIFTHTSTAMLKIMLETVRNQNGVARDGKIYVTHMARKLHPDHNTLHESLKPMAVTPAYDGMIIEI